MDGRPPGLELLRRGALVGLCVPAGTGLFPTYLLRDQSRNQLSGVYHLVLGNHKPELWRHILT